MLSVYVSAFVSGNPHFEAVLILSSDSILFVDREDDAVLSAFALKHVDLREDPQHPRAVLLCHTVTGVDTMSEASSVLTPSTQNVPRDMERNSRQSLSEEDSLVLTLFMDPVYLKPLLNRFRLFKSCF